MFPLAERDSPTVQPEHLRLLDGEFWQHVPAFRSVPEAEFLDHLWQARNSITKPRQLLELLTTMTAPSFIRDLEEGLRQATMALRVSPYLVSLIDWGSPYADPLRRQFLPVASEQLPDHPLVGLDSLCEQRDSPVPGLTHRYPDKALFLALDTCPVYCRFCTRSYTVGPSQGQVRKLGVRARPERWDQALAYLRATPQVEDVVLSGGDLYQLKASQLSWLGQQLLSIPHLRRLRLATKGLAVMPQKLLTDSAWFESLVELVERGRAQDQEVVLHTHIGHPNEITAITQRAASRLFRAGITVRNQAVLQQGVNEDAKTLRLLVRRLGALHIHPYYLYVHDLVRGVEDLRTSVETATRLEKALRGCTAGFNTPTFVVDAPGGGGKRDVHSYDYYDRTTGVSVYTAPAVRPGSAFVYVDPLHSLPEEGRQRWTSPGRARAIVQEALAQVQ